MSDGDVVVRYQGPGRGSTLRNTGQQPFSYTCEAGKALLCANKIQRATCTSVYVDMA